MKTAITPTPLMKRKDSTRRLRNATSKEQVYSWIINHEYWLEEILMKYFPSVQERNEFRQELWLIILQFQEDKLLKWFNNDTRDELKGIILGVINNQVCSNTSHWHKKFRRMQSTQCEYNNDVLFTQDDSDDIIQYKIDKESKLDYIDTKLDFLLNKNPRLLKDVTVFRMYYYDHLSFKKISDKTKIAKGSVRKYVDNIRYLLIKDKPDL